jgi:hypothetical protein
MKDIKNTLLIIACVVILFQYTYYKNKLLGFKQVQQNLTGLLSSIQIKNEFYELNCKFNYKMNGLKSPNFICKGHKNEEKLLSQIVKDRPLLIYRQVDKQCNSCKLEDFNSLFEFIKNDTIPVTVLCSLFQKRNIDILIKQKKIETSIYGIPSHVFEWDLDDGENPYFFVLYPDMKISHIYAPNKSYPEMNKAYLESVKRLLAD